MKEIWKDIIGYEGKYQVSNKGRIKSLNYKCTKRAKIIQPILTDKGYIVNLSNSDLPGKRVKKYKVAVLVARHFLGEKENENQVVLHLGEITDDRVENLKYGTRQEQMCLIYKNKKIQCICDKRNIPYEEYRSVKESVAKDVKKKTFEKRIQKGWNLEEATIPTKRSVRTLNVALYEYKGELLSIKQISEKYNINRKTIDKRLWRGWSIEEAIEIPLAKRKER